MEVSCAAALHAMAMGDCRPEYVICDMKPFDSGWRVVLFLLWLTGVLVAAQPHLRGTVMLSVLRGTIAADLRISNLPALANARFWLNVEVFRDSAGRLLAQRRTYAPDTTEEAWQYQLLGPNGRPLPQEL